MDKVYKILDYPDHIELVKNVNNYLEKGWKLYRFPFRNSKRWYQTIIKENKEDVRLLRILRNYGGV